MTSNVQEQAASAAQQAGGAGGLYLAFMLGGEAFAIEILRVREIVEYGKPTAVPMMPPSVCGVVNLRGAVVPVLDLAVRFGREPAVVGRRTCFVIVEVEYQGSEHVLGLLVDRVTAVLEIKDADIEPPPTFGTRINADFISGMARSNDGFLIILNIARALSIEEMAAIAQTAVEQQDTSAEAA
jgi:purine-binding chemotaxis protein CheW